jgi:hypothetical protein
VRIVLQPQDVRFSGLDATQDAATGLYYQFENLSTLVLEIANDGTASVAVTVVSPGTVFGEAVPDKVVTVPATERRFVGGIDPQWFNQKGDDPVRGEANYVYLNLDTTSGVKLTLLNLP